MDAETTNNEADSVLSDGVAALQRMLGQDDWEVSVQPEQLLQGDRGWDAVLRIAGRHDHMFTELLVDVCERVTPKDVAGFISSTAMLVRRINQNTRLMVFAPWISPKTQQELQQREIDYLDLTGNVSLRITRPAIIIRAQGADRAPSGQRPLSTKPLLTGPRAGRLVRLLADVKPPYRATDLAKESELSLSYVSKLLDSLEEQLLIHRDSKTIVHVDWEQLLRTRAATLNLMNQSKPVGMMAPNGLAPVIDWLAATEGYVGGHEVLVTGSYAARTVAPLAVGGQLMLYTAGDHQRLADASGLLPVPEAADVLLLSPWDRSAWQRPRRYERYYQVALSQLVLDCLSGPGRMPVEGEAVLYYMAEHEDAWRMSDFEQARRHVRAFRIGTGEEALF